MRRQDVSRVIRSERYHGTFYFCVELRPDRRHGSGARPRPAPASGPALCKRSANQWRVPPLSVRRRPRARRRRQRWGRRRSGCRTPPEAEQGERYGGAGTSITHARAPPRYLPQSQARACTTYGMRSTILQRAWASHPMKLARSCAFVSRTYLAMQRKS